MAARLGKSLIFAVTGTLTSRGLVHVSRACTAAILESCMKLGHYPLQQLWLLQEERAVVSSAGDALRWESGCGDCGSECLGAAEVDIHRVALVLHHQRRLQHHIWVVPTELDEQRPVGMPPIGA